MKSFFLISLLAPILILTGCLNLSPNDDPTRFYTLNSKSVGNMNTDSPKFTIAVARVNIPEYVDRSQILREIAPNELSYAEFHRWSEPLEKSTTRVLAENIAKTVPGSFVRRPPWRSSLQHDYTVYVILNEFKARTQTNDILVAGSYRVHAENDEGDVHRAQFQFSVPVEGNHCSYENIASSMSSALDLLAHRISTESFKKDL